MTTPSLTTSETQRQILAHLRKLGNHINQVLMEYDWDEPLVARARLMVSHLHKTQKLVRQLSE